MRKLTTILLALFMIATPLSVIAGFSAGAGPEGPAPLGGGSFGGGDGTAGNPYIIEDVWDLQNMQNNLSANYSLANDFDASATSGWNSGAGFVPVGTDANWFNGSLDGRNYTIHGLFINRSLENYVGLFGFLGISGIVHNLGLVDASINGYGNIGGLVGYNRGTISKSYFVGTVVGNNWDVGGLVGYNRAEISESYFDGVVKGLTRVGGVAGYNWGVSGMITDSYSAGSVTGVSYVGGFCGYLHASATIKNSYSTASVTRSSGVDDTYIAGFVGRNYNSIVINSYSTGSVHYEDATDPTDKGFAGTVDTGVDYEMTGNFWDNQTSGQTSSAGEAPGQIDGKNTTEMMTNTTFEAAGWDFTDTWWMVDGQTRPFLRMEWGQEIRNTHQLQLMQMDLAANYTIMNDIDLTGYIDHASRMWGTNSTQGGGFWPVGTYDISDPALAFAGSLDGGNFTITGLYIHRPNEDNIGLFGSVSAAGTISNVAQHDAVVTGRQWTGGFTGRNFGIITNCDFGGTVIANQTLNAGGISGINFNTGIISNCTSSGDVGHIGGQQTGGIVGDNQGTVRDSHSSMTVQGNGRLGGLVGWHRSNGEIIDSSAHGDVNGNPSSSNVGGLVGETAAHIFNSSAGGNVSGGDNLGGLVGLSSGSIENSHATGYVNSSGNFAGGLVGRNEGGTVNNSHASGNTTGNQYIGGLIGYHNNNAELTNSSASGDVIGLGNMYAGGLVGYNNLGSIIINSFAVGNTTGHNYVGGLAGYNNDATVTDSYAKETVEGTQWVGGLVGYNTGTIRASNATGNTTGGQFVGGLVGWNDGDIVQSHSAGIANGTGTIGGLVGENRAPGHIEACTAAVDANTNDFAGGLIGFNYGTVNNSHATGDIISDSTAGGLIGYQDEGGFVNNSYAAGTVNGGTWSGGLIGRLVMSYINNSHATGAVDGGYNAGGLVGSSWKGDINNSYATGHVSGGSGVGGFIGENDGNVSRSYSTGDVSGEGAVGGFVGVNTGNVSNSYAWGSITRKTDVGNINLGGFVGYLNKGRVTNSYSIGRVSYIEGADPTDSGFAGATDPLGHTNMTGNYWDVQTSLQSDTQGNATGRYSWTMMRNATFQGWDFTNIWGIHEDKTYPFLRPFGIPAEPVADLEITIEAAPDPAQLGGTVTYKITLHNHGPDMATGVLVNVTLPAGTSFEDSTQPFNVSGRYLELEAPNMPDGDTLVIFVNVTVDAYGTGEIECTANVTTASQDPGAHPNEDSVISEVNHPPVITTEDVTIATIGVLYSVQYEADDPDDTDLTWSVTTSLELLTMSAGGLLSGTPGSGYYSPSGYQVNVTVSDGRGGLAWSEFTLFVNAPPYFVTEQSWFHMGTVGVPYSMQINASDPDGDPLTWDYSTNASWLTVNATGYLSGTPTAGGTYWLNVSVDDGRGGHAWRNFTLDINAPPVIHTTVLPAGYLDVAYGFQVNASDPNGDTLHWYMQTNTIWLQMNNNGYLSGIPIQAGTFWVNVTVLDHRGGEAWRNFTLTVEPEAPDDDDDDDETIPIVIGPVLDSDGDPVPGATVTVTIGTDTYPGVTNATGHAIVNVPESAMGEEITVDITREGYDHISYTTTLGADGTLATQPPAMDEAEQEPEDAGGIGGFTWIIIIIVIVAVLGLVAFMMMGKGKAPVGAPEEAGPEEAEAMPGEEPLPEEEPVAEPAPEETAGEPDGDVPPEE